jgi:hypothetical protein
MSENSGAAVALQRTDETTEPSPGQRALVTDTEIVDWLGADPARMRLMLEAMIHYDNIRVAAQVVCRR